MISASSAGSAFWTQFVEQDPGPRGSPQLPHGAGGACVNDLAGVLDCAAKTESCFCNSTL